MLGLLGAGAALPGEAIARGAVPVVTFDHGIASGNPSTDGAVLRTRVTPPAGHGGQVPVTRHVADGGRKIATGHTDARPSRDWTSRSSRVG